MNIIFNKPVSNITLFKLCERMKIPLKGIYMKNELPTTLHNGAYIINLEDKGQAGSHWTGFWRHNRTIFWFDSFGVICPQNEQNIFFENHNHVLYSEVQIQSLSSSNCGLYVLGFFLAILHFNGTIAERIYKYQDMFDHVHYNRNDRILESFILQYNK